MIERRFVYQEKIFDMLDQHGAKYFCDPAFEDDFKK